MGECKWRYGWHRCTFACVERKVVGTRRQRFIDGKIYNRKLRGLLQRSAFCSTILCVWTNLNRFGAFYIIKCLSFQRALSNKTRDGASRHLPSRYTPHFPLAPLPALLEWSLYFPLQVFYQES